MEKEIDDKFEKNQDSDQNIKESSVFNKTEETEETGELSSDDKLKDTQEKLLRALAETENQRRRFEKETSEAFEYGGFLIDGGKGKSAELPPITVRHRHTQKHRFQFQIYFLYLRLYQYPLN